MAVQLADGGPPAAPAEVVLSVHEVRKSFSGVEVLHGVDFSLRRGEVHGIVGQNGAGKSTLVKIIDGAYERDAGEIAVNGVPVPRGAHGEFRRRGIAMVFQEFSLIPSMSVADNIMLTREPTRRTGLIDQGEVRRQARAALGRVGADIDPDQLIEELPVGSRQLVEIAKAISQDASILILDEPTSSLTAGEIATLTAAIGRLTADGISVIYISHHIDEVIAICDRLTVIRDGVVTLTAATGDVTLSTVIEQMLGRSLENALVYQGRDIDRAGEPLLRVEGLRTDRLRGISFELRGGEILGVAGLLGSGRSELLNAIFGIDRLAAGSIHVRGKPVTLASPRAALNAGIALIPEDRARSGLVREHSVVANMSMAAWSRFARVGFIDDRAAARSANALVDRLRVQVTGLDQEVKNLSGGNQQKVVVAKNLTVQPSILLLDDPTVGVDIGAKREILMQVRELAATGHGIVLVSSEFAELSGVADRVLVMKDGQVRGVLDRAAADDLSEEALSRAVQQ
jgi:ribose transport system ATP-binding protein